MILDYSSFNFQWNVPQIHNCISNRNKIIGEIYYTNSLPFESVENLALNQLDDVNSWKSRTKSIKYEIRNRGVGIRPSKMGWDFANHTKKCIKTH